MVSPLSSDMSWLPATGASEVLITPKKKKKRRNISRHIIASLGALLDGARSLYHAVVNHQLRTNHLTLVLPDKTIIAKKLGDIPEGEAPGASKTSHLTLPDGKDEERG